MTQTIAYTRRYMSIIEIIFDVDCVMIYVLIITLYKGTSLSSSLVVKSLKILFSCFFYFIIVNDCLDFVSLANNPKALYSSDCLEDSAFCPEGLAYDGCGGIGPCVFTKFSCEKLGYTWIDDARYCTDEF